MKEGWNWLLNSRKWHYFCEDGRALCGKFLVRGTNADAQEGNDTSPDNCKACRIKLAVRQPKGAQGS